jgi:hypothetical protein
MIACDGIDSGEFVPIDPVLVREAIAPFVLRALLADPSELAEVRLSAGEAQAAGA